MKQSFSRLTKLFAMHAICVEYEYENNNAPEFHVFGHSLRGRISYYCQTDRD